MPFLRKIGDSRSSSCTVAERSTGFRLSFGAAVRVPFFAACLLLPGCHRPHFHTPTLPHQGLALHTWSGETMGTTYRVKVVDSALSTEDAEELHAATADVLERLNGLMSTYDPESEVSRFNDSSDPEPMPISTETAEVIRLALDTWEKSDGAFDITVGPLVELWGFGAKGRRTEPPSEDAIAKCLGSTGSQRLYLTDAPALAKGRPDVRIDLSAVAKGYAVDEVATLLDGWGATNYLVEIGGECRAKGENDKGQTWRLGVDRPTPGNAPGEDLQKIIALEDAALATSGDYRNFFEYEGKRYSHTIDPRTGRPVTHSLASVSVIAPTCAEADALATAIMVLGPVKGLRFAEDQGGIEALLIEHTSDEQLAESATTGMAQYVVTASD